MLSPRWRKLLGDLKATKGRMVMMVLAIAVGVLGVGTILSAYTILTREITVNYQTTNPASAYIRLDQVKDSLVNEVRDQPGIEAAELTSWVESRIEVSPNEWMPLLLFVVEDFNNMQLNQFWPEVGAWPPTEGSILLERTALTLVDAKVGDSLRVQTTNGSKVIVPISGLVHDPGLAPAGQEQTAYGYITPSTLALLGETEPSPILKVLVLDDSPNKKQIESTVGELAGWIQQMGYSIEEIRIPPPGQHPHQTQMTSILVMMFIFSAMALILSAILTATMIGGLLAQQVRQIGVMKAIGARTRQIAGLYLSLVAFMGIIAIIIGLPLGNIAGQGFAKVVADMLNITLYSISIPIWSYVVLLVVGILVPILISLFPILRATRITVREAINDFGTTRKSFGSSRMSTLLGKIRGVDRTLLLSLRNTFRRRSRLILTLILLAAAGAMFLSSLNVKMGWEKLLSDAASSRLHDIEIRFHQHEPQKKLIDILQNVSGVKQVEIWNLTPAAADRKEDQLNIVRTYPDGGHGSFNIRSVPADSTMNHFSLMDGRALQPNDLHAAVLNHMALALFPNVQVGDFLPLTIDGKPVQLQVVGIVRENLLPAAAYLSLEGYANVVKQSGQVNAVRISVDDPEKTNVVINEIERTFEKENISIEAIISESMINEAVGGHVYILIFALIFISVLMAIVGALGLLSTMGTNVVERTREFGIMRTIGGRSGAVMRNIISEGVLIGLMSYILAVIICIPVTSAVGKLIGNLAFRSPLPLVLSPMAILIWLFVIVVGAVAASAYPAWKASRLTIRDTLDYL
ncbi:ABC transporter permease [Paenibacillus sp. SC116]|uniref:ABC transporter permease n=1 Tax=Paenibacillus sp. SC116 TaxID=2968986 RepID=UPI00215B7366|nr:ABC transporter permease [Paenibacillus sp. SC116]MCR8843634.1 ABC transporter permease [Paenibacillus sp. SC116]